MSDPIEIDRFVLYSEQSLALAEWCHVVGGDLGVRSVARDSVSNHLTVERGSRIDADRALIAPSVVLGREVAHGPVRTNELLDDCIPLRSQRSFPASAMPPLPLAPAPAAGSSSVTIEANAVLSLNPGAYDALTVCGSLVLNPGEYTFSSVTVDDTARLVTIGMVRITVIDYLSAGRRAQIHPLFDKPADQLWISVAGIDSTSGNPAASFGEHAHLSALLSAPHGTVAFADHVKVRGAVAGYRIAAGEAVLVEYECGFPLKGSDQVGSQQLTGAYGVPPGPDTYGVAGPVPADTTISLSIGLPVRDADGLQTLITAVSNPKDAQFRKYVTQSDFNATYGATAADYEALKDWATNSGFTIIATFPNNLLLRVVGTAAQVQQALYINLIYRARPDGSLFVATDRNLSLDLSVPVLDINGLGDVVLPVALSLNGTGAAGSYRAADLRNAYLGVDSPFQALDGSGQIVGIVDYVGFVQSDVTGYFGAQVAVTGEKSPLPPPNVTLVETESAPIFSPGPPPNSAPEANLDVEMVYAMAPGATILMFQGTTGITGRLDSILHGMATFSPALTVASCSLSFGKSDSSQQALDQMAAQGVSFFTASGDYGDVGSSVYDSTKMNHQTLVGGTILNTAPLIRSSSGVTYPTPYYVLENTWPSSGGGVISDVPIPDYQTGIMAISAAINGGSTTQRNYPDVAMLAQNAEIFTGGSLNNGYDGTSFAAPLWAGFTALVNQMSLQNNAGLVGFLNPTLYDIGLTRGEPDGADLYSICFNDIADGVANTGKGGAFKSVPGYDLVTGLGTPTPALFYQLTTLEPSTPNQPLALVRFIVTTGDDNLRNDSSATADVFLKNGGTFTVTLKTENGGSWGNGSVTGPLDFPIPSTVTLPTQQQGLSGVRINLGEHPHGSETPDNWDIAALQVSLFNPGSEQVCQLNLVGSSKLQDGSTGLVRLSNSPGGSGVGQHSPIFPCGGPESGC